MGEILLALRDFLGLLQAPRFGIPLPVLYLVTMCGVIFWGGLSPGTDLPAGGPGDGGLGRLGLGNLAGHPSAASHGATPVAACEPPAVVWILSLYGDADFPGGLDQLCQQPDPGRQGSSPLAPGPAVC